MAISEASATDWLPGVLDGVARALARHAIKEGDIRTANASLRIEREQHVKRNVQVYWTPFEAYIPDTSIGLHLEVAKPTVHWAEAYLSPNHRNWVFIFAERPDGEIQLAYHGDYATPAEAMDMFFSLSSWYVLTATDSAWGDVLYQVADDLPWGEPHRTLAGASTSTAIQESLKKSTIFWLKWRTDKGEKTMPVWFVYDQKATRIFVLSGERQQTIPEAEQIRECEIILRWKGKNASVAEIPASVRVIRGADPEWDEVADKVAEKRLNIPGTPEDTARRWKDECVILELTLRT
ncbi:MAG TPA: hypothetical protein VE174_06605 [Actinomycetota bacterium]|nr:hypothetical protein [Actinomycetota bacterium]